MFKKVFAATLAGLFITAPAFANIEEYGADKEAYENSADFKGVKMSGSFFIKGNYKDIDGNDYSYYESDFEVKTNFVVSEKTSATLVVEAFDNNWAGGADTDTVDVVTGVNQTKDADGKVTNVKPSSGKAVSGEAQNHLQVTKATLNHTFDTGTTVYGGVSGSLDTWGTDFADDQSKVYFLQFDQVTPFGTLTFKNEKIAEGDIENDDKDIDGYLLGLSMDAAGFTFKPAVYVKEDQSGAKDATSTKFMLPISGKIGAINLTSEFIFSDEERLDGANVVDGTVFGAWIDAATTVSSVSFNASLFYSGTDDGFALSDEGANLCPMEILGDDITLSGATLVRVKASKAITDKVSVDASLAYMFTNFDDKYIKDNAYGDTGDLDNAYEFNANASFKASDAVTLSCGVAYLDGEKAIDATGKTADLKDPRVDAYAKINLAF
ncbi:MAG: hypothetical protein MI742_11705 [Desulfobacterales bacterium]|nr:hypothetical protein [Desulfobacterales bacterium]